MIRLFRYLQPFKWLIISVLLFIFLQSMADLFLPQLMSSIVDVGIINGDTAYIVRIGGLMLLVAALGAAFSISASFVSAKVSAGFGKDIRNRVFTHVENFSLQEVDKIGTASLINRTTNDINQVQQVLMMMMRMMVMAPMMCIGGIIMAVYTDAKLSTLFIFILPVLALTIWLVGRKGTPYFKKMQVRLDELNLVLREGLTGNRVIRAFNRIGSEKRRFEQANQNLTDTAIRGGQIMAMMMPLMMIILNVCSIAIIWFGGIRIDAGNMQVGQLMAFLQYAMQIMFSLIMVSMLFVMIPRASASAIRINEVLETKHEIVDRPATDIRSDSQPLLQTKSEQVQQGILVFEDVSFHYANAEMPALRHISFTANPGTITAIIGGTGSGKSTLANLIPRFYDVSEGRITLDGFDIRDISQAELRHHIGYVPQKAVLFSGTISENIRYGKDDATDEEIRHAASVAQAESFIAEMKAGYETILAQGGSNVSGGQKQRLSIARALVRKPRIYIFDDSFSALDYKTDAKLRAALRPELQHSTTLIVAQRISTVMDADQIIVLDEGEMVGIGRHEELLETCKVYQEIATSQLTKGEIA